MSKVSIQSNTISLVLLRQKNDKLEILLLKRADKTYQGLWTHIYGGIKKNEKAWEAALRELYEETSLENIKLYYSEYCEQFYVIKNNSISIVPAFIAVTHPSEKVVLNHEHSAFKWCSLKKAINLAQFPEQKKLYKHIKKYFSIQKPLLWTYIDTSKLGNIK